MATQFKLPELGENIESASVTKILVSEGQRISVDQPVLELETDKATIEVPSSISGIVQKIHVQEGARAAVGQVVLTVETESETGKEGQQQKTAATTAGLAAPGRRVDVLLPELGENIDAASVIRVLVKTGETVFRDQPLLEMETDKATFEMPSSASGKVEKIHVKEGDKIRVGQPILTLEIGEPVPLVEEKKVEFVERPVEKEQRDAGEKDRLVVIRSRDVTEREAGSAEEKQPSPAVLKRMDLPEVPRHTAPAAPSVRRFAREIGVNINKVPGTGPRGRISIEDVKRYARQLARQQTPLPAGGMIPAPALPDFSKWGPIEKVAMTSIRAKTAEHTSIAWTYVPHVTQYDRADITELEEHRKQYAAKIEESGGKLTITAILIKVVASALRVFPQFNASVDPQRNEIIYKKYYHIGVAVDTGRGLLVPVIRDVDKKNIRQIAKDLTELSDKARNKKITLEEMQGGTFTITNLGGIGGTYFSPIVNYPEVAILGVSRSSFEPVYIEGKFEPRLILPLSLSYDHRIIDGADAARFVRWVADALKNPFLIALEG